MCIQPKMSLRDCRIQSRLVTTPSKIDGQTSVVAVIGGFRRPPAKLSQRAKHDRRVAAVLIGLNRPAAARRSDLPMRRQLKKSRPLEPKGASYRRSTSERAFSLGRWRSGPRCWPHGGSWSDGSDTRVDLELVARSARIVGVIATASSRAPVPSLGTYAALIGYRERAR